MKKVRVLVVDDEPFSLEIVKMLFNIHFPKFEIDTAISGEIAIDLCNDKIYDIILLDISMPNLSGYDVVK